MNGAYTLKIGYLHIFINIKRLYTVVSMKHYFIISFFNQFFHHYIIISFLNLLGCGGYLKIKDILFIDSLKI